MNPSLLQVQQGYNYVSLVHIWNIPWYIYQISFHHLGGITIIILGFQILYFKFAT